MRISRSALALLMGTLSVGVIAREAVKNVWVVSSESGLSGQAARIRPEVHSVRVDGDRIELTSAGTSLHYFGPLQAAAEGVERVRRLRFRLPLRPQTAKGAPMAVRPDVIGVLITGVPIRNQLVGESWNGQNIWHIDPIAAGDDGSFVAGGRPRADATHSTAMGVLGPLIADETRHSPIIGYALDGYPIYGPWAEAPGAGRRRMRSGYRLRQMLQRNELPDGTRLLPGQVGPDVGPDYPLGTFVEDYEFVEGAGDLDRFNGRIVVTPEYPQGTYAYFLTTDEAGRLSFPYLLAGEYRGEISRADLREGFRDLADEAAMAEVAGTEREVAPLGDSDDRVTLNLLVGGTEVSAGRSLRLSFVARGANGRPVRFLEHVHERPLHLLIVSEDLAEFAHIHPEAVGGDRYEVAHTFAHGGRYRLYADFTPPGGAQRIVRYQLRLGGAARRRQPLPAGGALSARTAGVEVAVAATGPLRAGEDVGLSVTIRDGNGLVPATLEPWLGAWGHFVLIDPAHRAFIHAHPIEEGAAVEKVIAHDHAAAVAGPPPDRIRTSVLFPFAGKYKLWAQFRLAGEVIIQPFVLDVAPAGRAIARDSSAATDVTATIRVGAGGFSPAEIRLEGGRAARLRFVRETQPNCGGEVVFPDLGLRRRLPPGESTVIELPPLPAGTLRFGCGMGMYKGAVIVKEGAGKNREPKR